MKKVVITGATGMIGNALLKECIANHLQVLIIIRPNSLNINRIPKSEYLQVYECDLSKLSDFDFTDLKKDWDVFYHFGWNFTSSQYRNNVMYQYLNIGYTLDAINLAQQLGCTKFVGAGSQAEFGVLKVNKISPEMPSNPETAYGIAKLAAEKMTILWARQNKMDCIWGRIFSVYGQYDLSTTMISSTLRKMLNGERTSFTEGKQMWDYLYSEDAAHAFYLMGSKVEGHKVYCVGSGESKPLCDYIYAMKNIINPELEIGIGDIPYVDDPLNLCADILSLQRDTGFEPSVDFKGGIQRIIKSLESVKSF